MFLQVASAYQNYIVQGHNDELNARAKQYEKKFSHMLQPREVEQRLAQLGDALKKGDRTALELSRDGGSFQNALKDLGNVLFDLLGTRKF